MLKHPDFDSTLKHLGRESAMPLRRMLTTSAALVPFRQVDGSFRIGAICRFLVAGDDRAGLGSSHK